MNNFEKAMHELNEILQKFQDHQVPLDELTLTLERANQLIHFCRDFLEKTHEQVIRIVEDFDQILHS